MNYSETIYEDESDITYKEDDEEIDFDNIKKQIIEHLEKGNIPLINGWSPLHWAVLNEELDFIKVLCNYNCIDIDYQDNEGNTAMHLAAFEGNERAIDTLFYVDASLDIENDDGIPPFFTAARQGNIEAVKTILAHAGHLIEHKDEEGWTALNEAVWNGNQEVVEYLLEKGAKLGKQDELELLAELAIEDPSGDIYYLLHDYNILETNHEEALAHMAIVRLNASLPVEEIDGHIPLHWALRHGFIELAYKLIDLRQDINEYDPQGLTPIHIAAMREDGAGIINKLVLNGAVINAYARGTVGTTALHEAVLANKLENIITLISLGMNPNQKGKNGWTALDIAVEYGYQESVRLLSSLGANVLGDWVKEEVISRLNDSGLLTFPIESELSESEMLGLSSLMEIERN